VTSGMAAKICSQFRCTGVLAMEVDPELAIAALPA